MKEVRDKRKSECRTGSYGDLGISNYQLSNPMLLPKQTPSQRLAMCIERNIKINDLNKARRSLNRLSFQKNQINSNVKNKTIMIRKDITKQMTKKLKRFFKLNKEINVCTTSVNFRKKQSREAYISKIKPTCTSCIMHYEPRKIECICSTACSRNDQNNWISINIKKFKFKDSACQTSSRRERLQRKSECSFQRTGLGTKSICDRLVQTTEDSFLETSTFGDSFAPSFESGYYHYSNEGDNYDDSDETLTNDSIMGNSKLNMLPRININIKLKSIV